MWEIQHPGLLSGNSSFLIRCETLLVGKRLKISVIFSRDANFLIVLLEMFGFHVAFIHGYSFMIKKVLFHPYFEMRVLPCGIISQEKCIHS